MAGQYGTSTEDMAQAAAHVLDVSTELEAEFSKLRGQLDGIGSAWSGPAATAFMQLMERYNTDAMKIKQALEQISQAIKTNGATYEKAEEEVGGAMSSIMRGLGG
jgi:WXG100 family type VII secretion target